jgi:AhpD family alkylhydroperoxidase
MEPRFDFNANDLGGKFVKRYAAANHLIQQSTLPRSLQELVSLRASQLNGCGWCVDIHAKEAMAAGETPLRLVLVSAWRETTVFTDAERAALALAEEVTLVTRGVSDDTWLAVRKHFDDDQTAALVALLAQINAANRMSVAVGMRGGSYEPGMFD